MGLNSLKVFLLVGVLGIGSLHAQTNNDEQVLQEMNEDYLRIEKLTVSRVEKDVLNQETIHPMIEKSFNQIAPRDYSTLPGMPNKMGQVSLESVGQVLMIAQGVVALGEQIYTLVQHGKPHTTTTYAPISVLPRVGTDLVDIFDTENWKNPKKYTYKITYTNGFGMDVVTFKYSVIFAYGGSYNDHGAYITAAQIIPEQVQTSFGFDFSATMKLGGIQNHGTKLDPVAGAILSMQYTVETFLQSTLEAETYHITGKGGFKQL